MATTGCGEPPRFSDRAPFLRRRRDVVEACVLCGEQCRTFAMKTVRTSDGVKHVCRRKH